MSTELGIIKGRAESILSTTYNSSVQYDYREMAVTKFSCGIKKGTMIQLTCRHDYIQLEKNQIIKLIKLLLKAL